MLTPTKYPHLLDIFIPTYNRPSELSGCLHALLTNYLLMTEKDRSQVCFFVSDNFTIKENIGVLVSTFVSKGIPVTYHSHSINIGGLANVEYCYSNSTAEYILVLCDDDFLCPNALSDLVYSLKRKKPDLVFLPFIKNLQKDNNRDTFIFDIMERNKFLETVSIDATLLSSLVFRNSIIKNILIPKIDNPFPHYYYLLHVLEVGNSFIRMNRQMLQLEYPGNSGGYDWFQVFVENFSTLLDDFPNVKLKRRTLNIVKAHMLIRKIVPIFLGTKIYGQSKTLGNGFKVKETNSIILLMTARYYYTYSNFWLFMIPISLIPRSSLLKIGRAHV